ncbi:MAG: glycerol-3-phosphate dehydrogenase C-terminal domain-containing protein, partial [Robiginitalea sp.]
QILSVYKQLNDQDPYWRLMRAELHFGLEFEMIQNPMDFLIRRTGRLYFDIGAVRSYMDRVIAECVHELGVDTVTADAWKEELVKQLEQHSSFTIEIA